MSDTAATSQQIAYECDAVSRLITVVYIGQITDCEVINFYRHLMAQCPDAPDCDFLLDMRYTDWWAKMDTIVGISQLFDGKALMPERRRVAVVRKEKDVTLGQAESALVRHGLGQRSIRYFGMMEAARIWLLAAR